MSPWIIVLVAAVVVPFLLGVILAQELKIRELVAKLVERERYNAELVAALRAGRGVNTQPAQEAHAS